MNTPISAPFLRVGRVAAVAMSLAVIVGACGSSATPVPTPPPDPKTILQSGATALSALKSVHVQIDVTGTLQNTDASASPSTVTLDGTKLIADIDIANQKGTASLVTPAGLGGLTADLIVSGDIYVKAPLLLNTQKWSQIPAAMLSSLGGGALSSPLPSAAAGAGLDQLFAMSGVTVTNQGTDTCADGTCNKVQITIPGATLQQAAGAAASANPLGGAVPGLGSLGSIGDATITVWTAASSGRLNKLTFAVSAGSAGSVTVAVTLSNFDQPITVTPPPADQVQPFSFGG